MTSTPSRNVLSTKAPEPMPLRSFALPSKTDKMEDHIAKSAMSSGPFEYVSMSGVYTTPWKKLLESLLAGRRDPSQEEISLDNIPPIILRERRIEIPFVDSLPKGYVKRSKEFFTINEVKVHFTPTQDFYDEYAEVKVALYDGRKKINHESRSVKCLNNMAFDARMSFGSSVHKDDVHRIKIVIECSNSIFDDKVVWGSLRLVAKFITSSEALDMAVEDTMAVLRLPQSALRKLKRNPYHVDLTVDSEDVDQLRDMSKRGRIIDFKRPATRQSKIAYSESEMGSNDGGSDKGVSMSLDKTNKLRSWTQTQNQLRMSDFMPKSIKEEADDAGSIRSDLVMGREIAEETEVFNTAERESAPLEENLAGPSSVPYDVEPVVQDEVERSLLEASENAENIAASSHSRYKSKGKAKLSVAFA